MKWMGMRESGRYECLESEDGGGVRFITYL